jgi:hypothetical protein
LVRSPYPPAVVLAAAVLLALTGAWIYGFVAVAIAALTFWTWRRR